MAKELFRPLYSPPGYKYRDAKAADLLRTSETWWVRVRHAASTVCGCKTPDGRSRRGTPHTFRESTKTNDKAEAKLALAAHKKALANDVPIAKRSEQPTFSVMAQHLRLAYANDSQDVVTLNFRLAHLGRAFGNRLMIDLRQSDFAAYKAQRRASGATNGTINRELSALLRAFKLGCEMELLTVVPHIKKSKEAPARKGYFTDEGYAAVLRHLPSDALRLACAIMHTYGWRKNEVMTLTRPQVNLAEGTLELFEGTTKNDDSRLVFLTPDLKSDLTKHLAKLDAWELRTGRRTQFVFTHLEGRHESKPIRDFVRSWRAACLAAELDGLTDEAYERRKVELQSNPEGLAARTRHDFRRTAVKNMLNLGVPESHAMRVTGHRSASVFKRYAVSGMNDLREVTRRLAEAKTQNGNGSNHQLGHSPSESSKVG